ncbi:MAG: hypothetical protein U9N12_02425 [Euryarchaeota archaeon]|nr:hypothetical protein [Euryarchaeota archaeon]
MIDSILGVAMPVSIMFAFYTLAQFSGKLGDALQLRPYYMLYYVAIVLLFAGIQLDLLGMASGTSDYMPNDSELSGVITAIGMTIGAAITIKYWGWLLRS